jgi:hypothetical protein
MPEPKLKFINFTDDPLETVKLVLTSYSYQPLTGEHIIALLPDPTDNGLISYVDAKAKCRHLKILNCKETLRQGFIRVYRLEIQSCWYFQPSVVNCCTSNLLSGSTLPLPPFPV